MSCRSNDNKGLCWVLEVKRGKSTPIWIKKLLYFAWPNHMDEVINKVSSFTRVKNSFWNCGRKVHATFRGGEIWDNWERYFPIFQIMDCAMQTMHWKQEMIY